MRQPLRLASRRGVPVQRHHQAASPRLRSPRRLPHPPRHPTRRLDYRLGNRSALESIIDQYRVSIDHHSGIKNDPNREDDERYILRGIGQVITVSLETQKIIATLPLNFPPDQRTLKKQLF